MEKTEQEFKQEFKIGSKVRCVRTQSAGGKPIKVGYVGKVTHISGYRLAVDNMLDVQGNAGCYYDAFELVKEETKQMKPTDKITVEVSLAELAEIYLIMGFAHSNTDYKLWNYACELLDPKQEKDDQLTHGKDEGQVLNFRSYQDEIKRVMFPEPVELKTPQQIQIEALQETITKAAMQIKLLKGGN